MSTAPRRLGKYELQQQLGHGSVGEVWKGYDLQLHRDVAIKILHADLQSDPDFLTRFTQEGQAIASLHHANIVQVRDVNISRPSQGNTTTAYVVMEYIEGQTLTDYLNTTSHKKVFPPVADIVYLFTSLGVAIDYAHQKGIVHGNIKPSNILLDRQNKAQFEAGEPMLTDFGLAKLLGEAGGLGAPLYMSPEQAKGEPANNRSDIYSLGVILYELCTGAQPFRDESSVAVMMQHINTLPTPPNVMNPGIPPALSEVILRAMAKDTASRYSIASLLATAIADACSMQSTITISQDAPVEEKEATDDAANEQHTPTPGVSHPTPRLPEVSSTSQSLSVVSPPSPSTSPSQPSQPSQPLPEVSSPLPVVTNNHAVIRPTPMTPRLTNKLPVPLTTNKLSVPTSSARVPVPPTVSSIPQVSPFIVHERQRARIIDAPVYLVVGVLFLLLLVIGSAIGTSLFLNSKGQTNPGPIVGQIFFQDDALGHDDLLRLEMQNVPTPPQGKMYVAWLQDTANHLSPLGPLPVNNGSVSLLYSGDAHHTNLLSVVQGLIVTLEDTGSTPGAPKGNTVYRASFDTASFQAIKDILYATPNFPGNVSVVAGLIETIKSINDKAGSIVDSIQNSHDYTLVKRQATRIIELVDGTSYAGSSGDRPADDPIMINTQVGLISSPTQVGYIDTLATQIDKVQQTADGNATLLKHIQNVKNAIADLQDWVQKIRTYDVQLLKAADLSTLAIISIALQLKQAAADSYTGRTIPPNQGPQPTPGSAGAYQAYIESQYMASLDVKRV